MNIHIFYRTFSTAENKLNTTDYIYNENIYKNNRK